MKTRGQIRNVQGRKDISNGKEKYPIPVKCPEHIPLPAFDYITTHSTGNAFYIPSDKLARTMKGCQCDGGKCNSNQCGCIQYSEQFEEIIECGDNCYCNENCKNRKFSNGIPPPMYLKYGDSSHGFGIYAGENIPKDTFVASYVGEICAITANSPEVQSDYTYSILSKVSNCEVEIDATRKGNVARFFNHSCNPNLKLKIAYFGLYRMPYPVFLAKANIQKGEQLKIDYGKEYFSKKGIPCECGECDGYSNV